MSIWTMNKSILLWILCIVCLISSVFAADYQQIVSTESGNEQVFGSSTTNSMKAAQSFTINGTGTYLLTSVTPFIRKQGTPTDDWIMNIYTDNSSSPNNTLISANATVTTSNAVLTSTKAYYPVLITDDVYVEGGVKYWYSFERSGALSTSDYYVVGRDTTGTEYPGHEFMNFDYTHDWSYFGAAAGHYITSKFNYSDPPVSSGNLTISATDSYNSTVLNLSVEMLYNGTTYNFNGTSIDTGLSDNTLPANITITSDSYDTISYTNYNISTGISLLMNLTLGRFVFDSNIKSYNNSILSSYNVTIKSITTNLLYYCNTTTEDTICFVPKNDIYNISVNVLDKYASNSIIQTYDTNISINIQNISLFTYNSIRINIYDLETNLLLTQNVTLTTIRNTTSFINNTINGTIYIDLLSPTFYEIRFNSENYTTQSKFITVLDDSTNLINIYLVDNNTVEIQEVHVLDSSNTDIEGGILWVQKQILGDTLWVTTQEVLTDFNGRSYIYIDKNPFVYYRFAVIYDGQQRPILPNNNLFTGKTSFISGLSEVVEILISLESDPDTVLTDFNGIITDLYYTGNETTIHFTWTDAQNSIYGANLTVECKYINNLSNYEVCYSNQLNAINGELNYTFPDINNTIYRISGYILTNINNQILFKQTIKRVEVKSLVDESTGFLILATLIPLIALVALEFGIIASIIAIGLTLTAFNLMNIVTLAPSIITGFVCLGFILFLRFKKNVE